jgi:RecJ-like exonuclease
MNNNPRGKIKRCKECGKALRDYNKSGLCSACSRRKKKEDKYTFDDNDRLVKISHENSKNKS